MRLKRPDNVRPASLHPIDLIVLKLRRPHGSRSRP